MYFSLFQNEKSLDTLANKNPWINEFVKDISLYESKKSKRENKIRYVPYTKARDLENYLNEKCKARNKELWNQILRCIIDDVMPTIQADGKDRFHVVQMLKTICKFASNTVPSVPIFRIE